MSAIEIRGVPPETVVLAIGDELKLRTAVRTDLAGVQFTGEKVLVLKLEHIDKGIATFRLGEEPFPFGGQFVEAAVADLERQAHQLQLLARGMLDRADEARRTAKVLEGEVTRDLEARRRP
jgi:hypothetical protein